MSKGRDSRSIEVLQWSWQCQDCRQKPASRVAMAQNSLSNIKVICQWVVGSKGYAARGDIGYLGCNRMVFVRLYFTWL